MGKPHINQVLEIKAQLILLNNMGSRKTKMSQGSQSVIGAISFLPSNTFTQCG